MRVIIEGKSGSEVGEMALLLAQAVAWARFVRDNEPSLHEPDWLKQARGLLLRISLEMDQLEVNGGKRTTDIQQS